MNTMRSPNRVLALLLAAAIGAGPALANPPSWAGGGKDKGEGGDKHEQKHEQKHERKARKGGDDGPDKGGKMARKAPQPGAYFSDRNREVVHSYYASAGHGGKGCPPGLAKKNNGCMPPGQAKKWQIGQPLPPTVVVYPVPQQIVVGLPPVPVGHKYVQVAGDILLIAVTRAIA
jgi:hypothetical protein